MTPKWLRVVPAIRSFILGEVERQYHPIGTQEFAERVEWMTDAWMWAIEASKLRRHPTIEDILFIAGRIEPRVNKNGFRTHGVYIGNTPKMSYDRIPQAMERLWQVIDTVQPVQGKRNDIRDDYMSADDFYLEFEEIHPFDDGNGRTGKILHNWLLGTLENPVLVHDYFGGGNP